MSEEQKEDFFAGINEVRDSKKLRMHTEDYMRTATENNKGTKDKTEYLPLGVWKKRGFDVKKIKFGCRDTKMHPVLGKLWGLEITQKWTGKEEKQTRGEDVIALVAKNVFFHFIFVF